MSARADATLQHCGWHGAGPDVKISIFFILLSELWPPLSVPVLMLLYSIVAGTGLGLMYVPAVVAVGYYFDKRRAFATGNHHLKK